MEDEVEVVPGVAGSRRFTSAPLATFDGQLGAHEVVVVIEFDESQRRYVCDEITVKRHRQPDGSAYPNSAITTDRLRAMPIGQLMSLELLSSSQWLRDLPNPDGREPWGRKIPGDLERKPTARTLAWVAHIYRAGHAVGYGATKAVQEEFAIPRTTAVRWVMAARDKGLLEPAEVGKSGG